MRCRNDPSQPLDMPVEHLDLLEGIYRQNRPDLLQALEDHELLLEVVIRSSVTTADPASQDFTLLQEMNMGKSLPTSVLYKSMQS